MLNTQFKAVTGFPHEPFSTWASNYSEVQLTVITSFTVCPIPKEQVNVSYAFMPLTNVSENCDQTWGERSVEAATRSREVTDESLTHAAKVQPAVKHFESTPLNKHKL